MRLVNVDTKKLSKFDEGSIPPYAILSHTWGKDEDEVSFPDIEAGKTAKVNSAGDSAIGTLKLEGCCRQAKADGFQFAWVDTCCIDKSNASEVTESINSMFHWYSAASVCYVHLADVPHGADPRSLGSEFRSSRWFTRGWTLQELLAPHQLHFFDSGWSRIGNKQSLAQVINEVTRIPKVFLQSWADFRTASVAQRMSWAASRKTLKREDRAYSLLGIFGVTMPMIYGERDEAFARLQVEIMKKTDDHSIFAWGLDENDQLDTKTPMKHLSAGILAPSPDFFAASDHIESGGRYAISASAVEANGGMMQISLILSKEDGEDRNGVQMGLLNCGPSSDKSAMVAIPLWPLSGRGPGFFMRSLGRPIRIVANDVSNLPVVTTCLLKHRQAPKLRNHHYGFYFEDAIEPLWEIIDVEPKGRWTKGSTSIVAPMPASVVADPVEEMTLVQVRALDRLSILDFVIVLRFKTRHDAEKTSAAVDWVMVVDGDTPLFEVYENFGRFRAFIRKINHPLASDGSRAIKASLAAISQSRDCMFLLQLSDAPTFPSITINASTELAIIRAEDRVKLAREEVAKVQKTYKARVDEQNVCWLETKTLQARSLTNKRCLATTNRRLAQIAAEMEKLSQERHKLEMENKQIKQSIDSRKEKLGELSDICAVLEYDAANRLEDLRREYRNSENALRMDYFKPVIHVKHHLRHIKLTTEYKITFQVLESIQKAIILQRGGRAEKFNPMFVQLLPRAIIRELLLIHKQEGKVQGLPNSWRHYILLSAIMGNHEELARTLLEMDHTILDQPATLLAAWAVADDMKLSWASHLLLAHLTSLLHTRIYHRGVKNNNMVAALNETRMSMIPDHSAISKIPIDKKQVFYGILKYIELIRQLVNGMEYTERRRRETGDKSDPIDKDADTKGQCCGGCGEFPWPDVAQSPSTPPVPPLVGRLTEKEEETERREEEMKSVYRKNSIAKYIAAAKTKISRYGAICEELREAEENPWENEEGGEEEDEEELKMTFSDLRSIEEVVNFYESPLPELEDEKISTALEEFDAALKDLDNCLSKLAIDTKAAAVKANRSGRGRVSESDVNASKEKKRKRILSSFGSKLGALF